MCICKVSHELAGTSIGLVFKLAASVSTVVGNASGLLLMCVCEFVCQCAQHIHNVTAMQTQCEFIEFRNVLSKAAVLFSPLRSALDNNPGHTVKPQFSAHILCKAFYNVSVLGRLLFQKHLGTGIDTVGSYGHFANAFASTTAAISAFATAKCKTRSPVSAIGIAHSFFLFTTFSQTEFTITGSSLRIIKFLYQPMCSQHFVSHIF